MSAMTYETIRRFAIVPFWTLCGRVRRGWRRAYAGHMLACSRKEYGKKTNPLFAFLASRCFMNFLSRPNFIAYQIGKKPLPVRLAERLGAVPVCWTSHSPENEAENDMVIFEFYRPETRYRG